LIVVGLVVTAATVWCKKHGIFCTLVPTAAWLHTDGNKQLCRAKDYSSTAAGETAIRN
jgi:hypothetical protein